jgi:hypothetical protein
MEDGRLTRELTDRSEIANLAHVAQAAAHADAVAAI